jgi:capsular polysaccharide biosynthesis protein
MMEGMDLRQAFRLLRRRWWILLGLPATVLAISLALGNKPARSYQVGLAFAIDIPREMIVEGSDEGTAAKVAEAIVDDFARILSRDVFAEAIETRLGDEIGVTPGEIASALSADDKHRIVELTVTRGLPAEAPPAEVEANLQSLETIALAVVDELEENGGRWIASLGEVGVALTLIDRPERPAGPLPLSLRDRLDLPLRLGLALMAGIGLSVGLHALDPKLRGEAEARRLAGAEVLGRIPK